ncbi:hypothetical protein PGT21_030285 [Puccinia graminis f. sp. tritici]|uniref:Uncharacterized protein n=1 Tax=Puccinia graminis f. sp. tritici TaxID=56615 RepID=A0A5B0MGA3_PUCGR|nr:hypothetical protein PGT21_030285 [Puccinia graminis f. sp. tritici]
MNPHSPPYSYYSISSENSPVNSFDEDGNSFTSFGSIHTPPRLRAMIRSIFKGTLIHSSAGSSPYERISDDVPAAIVAENLHPGNTFNDRRNRLLAAITPPAQDAEPDICLSDEDGEYEIDSSTRSSEYTEELCSSEVDYQLESGEILESEPGGAFNDHCSLAPIEPPAPDVDSIAHSSDRDAEYELDSSSPPSEYIDELGYPSDIDARLELGEALESERGHDIVSHVDPSLLPQAMKEAYDSDIESVISLASFPDDPKDTTYIPPRACKKRSKPRADRVRFSGCSSPKPEPVWFRPRDAKGRFIASRPKGKRPIAKTGDIPSDSPHMSLGSSSSSKLTTDQRRQTETATNTFLNTVLSFPADNYPFAFDHPNPFSTHLELVPAPAPDAGIDPLLPILTMNLPLHDPRMQFRAAVLHLFRVLEPFLTGFSPLRGEWELIEVMYGFP